jgi:hypothetical protein
MKARCEANQSWQLEVCDQGDLSLPLPLLDFESLANTKKAKIACRGYSGT